jgi:lipoprotein-releasing system ATP-binding protein
MEMGENKYSKDKRETNSHIGQAQFLLKAAKLKRTFITSDGEIEILRGIDLEIKKGEMTSIVGASGTGKSTLLYLLSGLDQPTSGSVTLGGQELSGMSEKKLSLFRNKHIGFVYQFHYLLSEFSALENVMLPCLIAGDSLKPAREKAYNILEKVNLGERVNHRPGRLSGGEQQRVAVARALVNSPDIIIADEPSGNLDEKSADQLHDLMADINNTTGITFLIATHNLSLAERTEKTYELSAGVLRLQ